MTLVQRSSAPHVTHTKQPVNLAAVRQGNTYPTLKLRRKLPRPSAVQTMRC
jgi:hypothetical protein